ncbi:MAG: tannase/feruloyl esterase family alpha/beta hydrolase [Myxococcales bacterium]
MLSGDQADSWRLYLVPGMNHSGDWPATDQFDLLTPLVRWVEQGRPPSDVRNGTTKDSAIG